MEVSAVRTTHEFLQVNKSGKLSIRKDPKVDRSIIKRVYAAKQIGLRMPNERDTDHFIIRPIDWEITALEKKTGGNIVSEDIKRLVARKRKIYDDLYNERVYVESDDTQRLRSIFTLEQISGMISFTEKKKKEAKRREFFKGIMVKVIEGTLSQNDVMDVEKEFDKTTASKLVIIFNDSMTDKMEKLLTEDGKTKELRRTINGLRAEISKIRSLTAFLDGLEERKFASSREFTIAIENLGSFARDWLKNMDWRDRPFLIKYAVGSNEQIEDPYGRATKYIDYVPIDWSHAAGSRSDKESLKDRLNGLYKSIKESRVCE